MESQPQFLDIMCEFPALAAKHSSYWAEASEQTRKAQIIIRISCFMTDRPSCLTQQKMIYGVSEKETAHISCTVDSNPKADTFFWTLNTTAGHSEIPGAMSTDLAGASLLTYKPMSQLEYGTIFCFGSNVVGRQRQPCVFHIIPASE